MTVRIVQSSLLMHKFNKSGEIRMEDQPQLHEEWIMHLAKFYGQGGIYEYQYYKARASLMRWMIPIFTPES